MSSILFYTIGLPGAGKTTLARRLSLLLACIHLRADEIGLELFSCPTYSPEERQTVQAEMGRRAAERLRQGMPVLYDAAMNTVIQRQALSRLAREHGGEAIGIFVETPLTLAKQRAASIRDGGIVGQVVRIIPPHIFDQYANAFEIPTAQEEVVKLSGNAPFYLQYRRFRRQLGDRTNLPHLI